MKNYFCHQNRSQELELNVDTKLKECFPCLHFSLGNRKKKRYARVTQYMLGGRHEWERDDTGKLERWPDENDISVTSVHVVVTFSEPE